VSDDGGHTDLALAFAFLAGALVGAGIALLFAPKTGPEMREQIADWAQRAREKAREAAARFEEASESEEH
jgi:gas vesicle protein